jgi:ElaB/YqjD/DUF883 family membrane-anchored ribosome-binding protein
MARHDPETARSEYSGAHGGAQPVDGGPEGKAREFMDKAGRKAYRAGETLLDEVTERAKSLLHEQKERAADELAAMADSFHQIGERLREQERNTHAHYVEKVAQQVERASGYIRGREVKDFMGEVGELVRREPVLFFGSAFAAGFLVARLLRRSGRAGAEQEAYRDYQSEASSRAPLSSLADIEDEDTPYVAH